jgi:hypothetical protein
VAGDVLDLELQSSTASGATTPVMAATVTTTIDEADPDPSSDSEETDDEVPGEAGSGDPVFGQDYWWHREGTDDTYDNNGNLTSSTPVSEDDPSRLGLMAAPSEPLTYCTPGSRSSLVRGDKFAMIRLKKSHVTKTFNNPATAIHFHIQSKLFYQTRTESALVQVTRRLPDARKRETLRVPRPSGTKPPWYSHTTTHIAVGGRVDYLMQLTYYPKAVIRSIEPIPGGRIVHYLNLWTATGTCRAR